MFRTGLKRLFLKQLTPIRRQISDAFLHFFKCAIHPPSTSAAFEKADAWPIPLPTCPMVVLLDGGARVDLEYGEDFVSLPARSEVGRDAAAADKGSMTEDVSKD